MTYTHNYEAFGEHVLRADWMEAAMTEVAKKIEAVAETIAPFDPESKDGSHYKDAFRVTSTTKGGIHGDRAEARVINDDEAAMYVEFGTRNNAAHHTLTRALDAGGQ